MSRLVNQYVNYHDMLERCRIENKELDKQITVLKTKVNERDKQIGRLEGTLIINERKYSNAIKEISNQSKKITDVVLQKFKSIKVRIIQELVDEKVQIIRENLKKKKEDDIFSLFEGLGVSKERVIEIIEKRG